MFAPGVFVFFIVEPGDLGPTAGLAGLPGSLIVRLPKWQCGRCERDLKDCWFLENYLFNNAEVTLPLRSHHLTRRIERPPPLRFIVG